MRLSWKTWLRGKVLSSSRTDERGVCGGQSSGRWGNCRRSGKSSGGDESASRYYQCKSQRCPYRCDQNSAIGIGSVASAVRGRVAWRIEEATRAENPVNRSFRTRSPIQGLLTLPLCPRLLDQFVHDAYRILGSTSHPPAGQVFAIHHDSRNPRQLVAL